MLRKQPSKLKSPSTIAKKAKRDASKQPKPMTNTAKMKKSPL